MDHPSIESANDAGINIMGGSNHSSVVDQLRQNHQAIAATMVNGAYTKVNDKGCICLGEDYLSHFPTNKKMHNHCKPDLHILFRYGRIQNDVIVVSENLLKDAKGIAAFLSRSRYTVLCWQA